MADMTDNHPHIDSDDDDEATFQEIFASFIDYTTNVDTVLWPSTNATNAITRNAHPPSPPPSEPDLHIEGINPNVTFAEMYDFLEHDLYTALANKMGFSSLPLNWKRIMYHAYNILFSTTVLQVPRIHRNTLIPQSIALARQQCEESNPLWAPEEDHMYYRVYIGDSNILVTTSMSDKEFRKKINSATGKAELAFHDNALRGTIFLLTSRPGHSALMPHLPGPPGTAYGRSQQGVVRWYLDWNETHGNIIWHNVYDDQIHWFDGYKIRDFLYSTLRDEKSQGFFGLQEAYRPTDGGPGIWTWRPLQAQGAAAVSVVSYALACANVSMRADFLQDETWDQEAACPSRRGAIEAEQTKIYNLLDKISTLSIIPGLTSRAHQERARDGLVSLLDYLGFTL